MNANFFRVLAAQFLTAFADNAVLFTAITLVLQRASAGGWYIPALQAAFLVAFVVCAPWVGRFADARPKPRVLFGANAIKATGAALLLLHLEPLLAYAVIGLGAAAYSPAKYGILPELIEEQALVAANGWIEGSTIVAILGGTLVGAALADHSVTLALLAVITLYAGSALIALMIKHTRVAGTATDAAFGNFVGQMRGLLATPRARFSTLGVSLFWAAATGSRAIGRANRNLPYFIILTDSQSGSLTVP
jgi:LPLT family lysophospholipid transporter-like MFS transporter